MLAAYKCACPLSISRSTASLSDSYVIRRASIVVSDTTIAALLFPSPAMNVLYLLVIPRGLPEIDRVLVLVKFLFSLWLSPA